VAHWRSRPIVRRSGAAALIAACVTVVAGAGLAGDVFAGFRRQAADALFPSDDLDPRVTVVGIDAKSILARATPWPWPRETQARLVDELTRAGARMVVLDVLYDPASVGDAALVEALRASPDAVVAAAGELHGRGSADLLQATSLTPPTEPIAEVSSVGHVNVTPDSDAVVRALPLAVEAPNGAIVGSVALVSLARLEGLQGPIIVRSGGVELGGRFIPTREDGRLEINYNAQLGRTSGSRYLSAADVLEGRLRPGELDGRIVLVGATDPALGDSHVTPVDKGGRMPGVFIHANALNTLLTRSYLFPAGDTSTLVAVFVLAFVVALATSALPLWAAAPLTLLAVAANFGWVVARFDSGVVADLVYPTLAALAAFVIALGLRYAGEARRRRSMAGVLTQYVPPNVARHLIGGRGAGGGLPSGSITFLFTDVVGSTMAWEAHPKEMSEAMRRHDSVIETAVQANNGAVVRPRGEGDSRFAVFVQPGDAVRTAAEITADFSEERWPTPEPIRVRMALHTGEAQLWEGDYYGSPPNRCARIRSVAEPGQILLSSTTSAAARADLPDGTTLRPLGPVRLKDFEDPEEVEELVVAERAKRRMSLWQPKLVEPAEAEPEPVD
jgi:CHASE2 domain-containing sensor protein